MSWSASLRENALFAVLALLYVAAASIAFALKGLPPLGIWAVFSNLVLYLSALVFLLAIPFLWALVRVRPERPFAFACSFAGDIQLRDRVVLGVPALAVLLLFLPAFSAFKSAIPVFHPYVWDPLFADWDAALHGGDAWRLIHPLVGWPFVTFVLTGVYHLWILLLYGGVLLVIGWLEQPRVRSQFLVAFVLAWTLLGTLGAIFGASVGPCFYEIFYGSDRYSPLMAYLAEADRSWPLMVLDVQAQLAAWYQESSHGLGRGISAMPSMHVAVAALFALAARRISRGWAIAGWTFLALILIGSVHVGYHYAIDGYASILAILPIWWLAGRLADRFAPGRADPVSPGDPVPA